MVDRVAYITPTSCLSGPRRPQRRKPKARFIIALSNSTFSSKRLRKNLREETLVPWTPGTRPEQSRFTSAPLASCQTTNSVKRIGRARNDGKRDYHGCPGAKRRRFDPKYLVGQGKLNDLLQLTMQLDCELVIFDQSLTPNQVRCISEATDVKVIDRSMLILDIFASRAAREGKLAVELAQLQYLLPRLAHKNTAFSRLAGGIGGRVQVKRSSKLIDDGQETASAVLRSNLHKQKYSEKTDEDAITVKSQRCLFSATKRR